MTPAFIYTIFLVQITIANSQLLLKAKDESSLASECLVKFMKKPNLQTTFVVEHKDYLKPTVQQILSALKPKEEISLNIGVNICEPDKPYLNNTIFAKVEQYFIFTHSAMHLDVILRYCLNSKWWEDARFIIIADDNSADKQMFMTLKNNFIFKALIVSSWNETYVSFKFALPRCRQIIQPHNIQLYNCLSNNIYQKHLFDLSKLATECNFKAGVRVAPPFTYKLNEIEMASMNSTTPYVGLELKDLSKIVNISFNSLPDSNELSGLIESLVRHDVDLLVGALRSPKKDITFVNPLNSNMRAHLIAVVKKRFEPIYYKFFKVFNWSVWLFVFTFVMAFLLLSYILSIYQKNKSFIAFSIILHLFSILTGQGTNFCKKYLKLPLLAWIWVTYIIRSTYEARITSFFIGKQATTQVNSLKEICEDKYIIFVENYIYDYLKEGLQISDCFIPPDRLHSSNNSLRYLSKDYNRVAVFTYSQTYEAEYGKYIDIDGRSKFHVIPEQIYHVPLSIYFNRKDPLTKIFQRKGRVIYETGHASIYHTLQPYKTKVDNVKKETSLTLANLWLCFSLYLYGMTLSIIVFCLELINFKFLKKGLRKT